MTTTPGLAEPQQERSRRSFARVRQATMKLLLEHGGPDFTLADVSAASAVSVGSIYGRVGNKANLLRLVQTEEFDRVDEEMKTALRTAGSADEPFEHAVQAVVASAVRPLVTNAPVIRAFMRLGDDDEEAARRGSISWETGRDEFCRALARITCRDRPGVDRTALEWCYEVVYSVTARQLGFGLTPGGRPDAVMKTDKLVDALGRTVRLMLDEGAED
ncbi:TetR/AcrR family transcriptional regulator [Luteimicrobium sp. DT211]|uniref:TetR/AcrR family transcriptional regulator n=1 Tax=Luteimicrobium sp. DT211 TaxID=3393412 RepID=UPI003CE980CF